MTALNGYKRVSLVHIWCECRHTFLFRLLAKSFPSFPTLHTEEILNYAHALSEQDICDSSSMPAHMNHMFEF